MCRASLQKLHQVSQYAFLHGMAEPQPLPGWEGLGARLWRSASRLMVAHLAVDRLDLLLLGLLGPSVKTGLEVA
jgi:hypothetical protein